MPRFYANITPWILVSAGGARTNPPQILKSDCNELLVHASPHFNNFTFTSDLLYITNYPQT